MRTLTLWLLFVLLLFGVLAFSWAKYRREIAMAAAVGMEVGSAIAVPPRSAVDHERSAGNGR